MRYRVFSSSNNCTTVNAKRKEPCKHSTRFPAKGAIGFVLKSTQTVECVMKLLIFRIDRLRTSVFDSIHDCVTRGLNSLRQLACVWFRDCGAIEFSPCHAVDCHWKLLERLYAQKWLLVCTTLELKADDRKWQRNTFVLSLRRASRK